LEGLAMEDVGIFMASLAILRANGIFYVHLVHFVVIWYIFRLVCCTEKNLATLLVTTRHVAMSDKET
jgi:type IV secretory pathway VirB3-like protein